MKCDPFIDCVLSKTPKIGVSFIRESIRVSCVCLLSVCRSAAVGQMIRVFSDTKLGRTILSNQSRMLLTQMNDAVPP